MKQKYTSHLAFDEAGGQSGGRQTLSASKQSVMSLNVFVFDLLTGSMRTVPAGPGRPSAPGRPGRPGGPLGGVD